MDRELVNTIQFNCQGITKAGKILEESSTVYKALVYKYPKGPFSEEKFVIEVTANDIRLKPPVSKPKLEEANEYAKALVDQVKKEMEKEVQLLKKRIDSVKEKQEQLKKKAQ